MSSAALAVAIQPDGKIVTAGESYTGSKYVFGVARYTTDGILDTSFNSTGTVLTSFTANTDVARSIAVQADGKIVVAGSAGGFALARYNPNGSLDTSFGVSGKVITHIGTGDTSANAIVIQSDGRIVAAGYGSNGAYFALVRYNMNGSLDTSFGGTGIITTSVGGNSSAEANAVALQTDGKIIAVGESYNGSNQDFAIVRYNVDGTLDQTFGGSGKVVTPIGPGYDIAHSVAIQTDGGIVVAGEAWNGGSYDFGVVRYNSDATLDTSFNGTGKVMTPINFSHDWGRAVSIQSDGKIVVAGDSYYESPQSPEMALVRYNIDGSLDTLFHESGIVRTQIGRYSAAYATAIQSDGKIVAAGYSDDNGSPGRSAVARYWADTCAVSTPTSTNTPTNTATATPTFTSTPAPTPTYQYTPPPGNYAQICTTLGSGADLYPSVILLQGWPAHLSRPRVTLFGLHHQSPDNLDILLVGPHGQKFLLMADAGGNAPIEPQQSVDLTFSDHASQVLPDAAAPVTGVYEPTSWEPGQTSFPEPAPQAPYSEPGSVLGGSGTQTIDGTFGGLDPNGNWNLYVRDDGGSFGTGTTGCIDGGWRLEFIPAISASISGRVTTANGQGVRNAKLVISGGSLTEPLVATTGSFGYFNFEGLATFETYVLTVNSKRFSFTTPSRQITLLDNVSDANFVADP